MNSKNKKIVSILIVAILVAVIGAVALYFYLVPQKTTVYVFKNSVKAGTVVTSDMLTPVQADSEILVAGAASDTSAQFVTGNNIDEVLKSGDSLRMDVSTGMPLTLSMLTANGGSAVEMSMDPTKIAITIPITGITGVTNDLKAGSRVNIYVTGADVEGNYSTTLAFQNMRILTVTKDDGGVLTSATVETTVEESLKLVYYSSSYSIYLGLIDSTGYEYPTTDTPTFSPNGTNNYTDGLEEYIEGDMDDTDTPPTTTEVPTVEAPSTEAPVEVTTETPVDAPQE